MNPELVRNAPPKPRRGEFRTEVRDRQNSRRTAERKEMDKALCLVRHDELDRGEIAIVPQDRVIGFNGPTDFYRNVNGRLELVASEKRIGVSSTRDGR